METNNNAQAGKSGQEYAELLCDFMFKRFFGSEANKDVLIGFLNMILEDANIEEVAFIPTEHFGLTEKDRKAIFDISAQCRDEQCSTLAIRSMSRDVLQRRNLFV
jgi:predicted transposase/invertase (TIGR01784 family)